MGIHKSSYINMRQPPILSNAAIRIKLLRKLGLGARVFDGLFDGLLDLIPVVGVNAIDGALEVALNHPKHLPLLSIAHERNGNTNATETTRTTDTVQVSLIIRLARISAALVSRRNVLN